MITRLPDYLPGYLVIFEDVFHMHHIEKVDEYLSLVRDLLRRSEGNLNNQ
ncbi:hypothetical protein L0665_01930 [Methanogenium marinum]|uniref:Uncharacterized protein n=1 Tax=Methanogenium marinum TaxID=348610 RepID=A0A9Q4KRS9_9EURY|nr:hypothetical protein [Methanogenium marinum]MDE4907379.1 hypothetical protein [Methanogenium marinum]